MTDLSVLEAESRTEIGKNANRRLKAAGKVPAVVYGAGEKEQLVALDAIQATKFYHTGHFLSEVIELKVGDDVLKVLPKDVHLHPVADTIQHVDFLRVKEDQKVKVWVSVKFFNREKSPGIKRGGVLNVVRHEIQLLCDPNSIPKFIEVDLDGTKIGQSLHISRVTLPEGAETVIKGRDFTIAAIAGRGTAKKAASEEEGSEEEAAS
ncbi:MAG: 50S ribosomal protein L25/general stress protein Ctc [Rickettsiales bacterium]|nr:50S ribosomal protein L25/general stress protein Ctc [Rickettsiales bacterium]